MGNSRVSWYTSEPKTHYFQSGEKDTVRPTYKTSKNFCKNCRTFFTEKIQTSSIPLIKMGICNSKAGSSKFPTYTLTSTLSTLPGEFYDLKAPVLPRTAVPQWTWTQWECQSWLCSLLNDRLGRGEEAARNAASKFNIDGNLIYLYTRDEWIKLLGQMRGEGIYEVLKKIRVYAKMPFTKSWGEDIGVIHLEIRWLV